MSRRTEAGQEGAGRAEGDPAVPAVELRLSPREVEQLYEECHQELLAFLIGVLRNPDDAHEALQSTFRRCLETSYAARAETRKGWLFKIAFHEALGLRRRDSARQRKIVRYGSQPANWLRIVDSTGDAPQEQQLLSQEQLSQLRGALQELPEEQRCVVERRLQSDETFAVIAAGLGVPIGTVLTRMRLALIKLKRTLQGPDIE